MSRQEHLHLIGIGGTGMTALAGLLAASGCRVTGSDQALYPPTSTLLERLGLEVHVGFDAAHLEPTPDLIVVGNAISRGNPEVEALLDRGLRYASMPQVIHDRFLLGRHVLVVAGTHGKTTTASMLAWVLTHAGRDPGYLIGGAPLNFEQPFHIGRGEEFVIEGDEYDTAFFDKGPKFMHYKPNTVLVGTVEFDHADIYASLSEVETAFERLMRLVPRNGRVIRYEECEVTRRATGQALAPIEGYGIAAGRWRAEKLHVIEQGVGFQVSRDGQPFGGMELPLFGEHNVRNALAVIAAAHARGLDAQAIREGLASFRGVRRRLEQRAVVGGVRVFDDFAHHPSAIAESLAAVRLRFPDSRVWAVVEPRSWSLRRRVFQDRLTGVFGSADEVLLSRVHQEDRIPAQERLDVALLAEELCARGTRARYVHGVEQLLGLLVQEVGEGDSVVIMSNGAFDGLHHELIAALETKTAVTDAGPR